METAPPLKYCLYPPAGNVSPDHKPGKKVEWTAQDPARFEDLLAQSVTERHCGGNGINVLAHFAVKRAIEDEVLVIVHMPLQQIYWVE